MTYLYFKNIHTRHHFHKGTALLQVGREKADTTGTMTEYANKLFTLSKTTLATGSRIAMNQYGKYVRKYQWQGDENAMSQYLAALLKLDFGAISAKAFSQVRTGRHTHANVPFR